MIEIAHVVTVTPLYAGLLAIFFIGASLRVVLLRRTHKVGIGDGGNRELARAIRVHGNAAEYVPTGVMLLLLLELTGSAAWLLHAIGAALFLGRCLHAWGLSSSIGTTPGRLIGMVLTWLAILLGGVMLVLGVLV